MPYRAVVGGAPVSVRAIALDDETIVGRHHFSHGYPAENTDGSVNAVIEIPGGRQVAGGVGHRAQYITTCCVL